LNFCRHGFFLFLIDSRQGFQKHFYDVGVAQRLGASGAWHVGVPESMDDDAHGIVFFIVAFEGVAAALERLDEALLKWRSRPCPLRMMVLSAASIGCTRGLSRAAALMFIRFVNFQIDV
jgi:hypothetical protein